MLLVVVVVVVAPLAGLYFVFARFCDLTENALDSLPWASKRAKKKVRAGLGLGTLRDIFSKLQHASPTVSVPNQAG